MNKAEKNLLDYLKKVTKENEQSAEYRLADWISCQKRIKELENALNTIADPVNDWIIRGVKGEYYPCKPDIFEMTYEDVKEQAADTCYKKFYNHIRSELDLAPMRNHDKLAVICKLCGKSFEQITGVSEQALKETE